MKRLGIFETYRIPVARFYYGLAVTHFPHHAVRAVECAEHAWNLAGWDSMPFSRTRRLLCRAVGFANYRRLARVIGSG